MKSRESTSTGRWADKVTPKRGWTCVDIIDLGDREEICQMCEVMPIRFVHVMAHDDHDDLRCGCICDGHMSGDLDGARARHNDAVNRAKRAESFVKAYAGAKWVETKKGYRARVKRWHVQIYQGKFGGWSSVVRCGRGEPTYARGYVATPEKAADHAMRLVQGLIIGGGK